MLHFIQTSVDINLTCRFHRSSGDDLEYDDDGDVDDGDGDDGDDCDDGDDGDDDALSLQLQQQ